ncbi:MAG TPA: phosphoribosyl-ATP diphosphatase [Turneriella sp.]|nr:phosphoribosyl-ATP diphosphatase [Turneriella sp.]HNA79264.1 phosphoribosyl-ATP diphosphatase [Turneriella sp.]HNE19803.1 phosphoribosyl-ATP diphosphatase [Turneriella sp.]HNL11152.1 phosphoribosyl-ATP diphosphatase [Turneriella sp.]HNL53600.1 phosphoribosyl-ATP diphosphatase [Turneriella sp.]
MNVQFLAELENLLKDRRQNMPEGSYTTKLYTAGPQKILQKVGEEAIEYILDAQNADKQKAVYEGADLLYHFMVSLVAQGWSLGDIIAELEKRHKKP